MPPQKDLVHSHFTDGKCQYCQKPCRAVVRDMRTHLANCVSATAEIRSTFITAKQNSELCTLDRKRNLTPSSKLSYLLEIIKYY